MLNKLNQLKNNKLLAEMEVFEETDIIRISLENTIYDYEYVPSSLMNVLAQAEYDWYNSVEIHVVK